MSFCVLMLLSTITAFTEGPRLALEPELVPVLVSGTFKPFIIAVGDKVVFRTAAKITSFSLNDQSISASQGNRYFVRITEDALRFVVNNKQLGMRLPQLLSAELEPEGIRFRCGPDAVSARVRNTSLDKQLDSFFWEVDPQELTPGQVIVVDIAAASGVRRLYNVTVTTPQKLAKKNGETKGRQPAQILQTSTPLPPPKQGGFKIGAGITPFQTDVQQPGVQSFTQIGISFSAIAQYRLSIPLGFAGELNQDVALSSTAVGYTLRKSSATFSAFVDIVGEEWKPWLLRVTAGASYLTYQSSPEQFGLRNVGSAIFGAHLARRLSLSDSIGLRLNYDPLFIQSGIGLRSFQSLVGVDYVTRRISKNVPLRFSVEYAVTQFPSPVGLLHLRSPRFGIHLEYLW